jgi:hypothetical protein
MYLKLLLGHLCCELVLLFKLSLEFFCDSKLAHLLKLFGLLAGYLHLDSLQSNLLEIVHFVDTHKHDDDQELHHCDREKHHDGRVIQHVFEGQLCH